MLSMRVARDAVMRESVLHKVKSLNQANIGIFFADQL
jgi:hypothetical protein